MYLLLCANLCLSWSAGMLDFMWERVSLSKQEEDQFAVASFLIEHCDDRPQHWQSNPFPLQPDAFTEGESSKEWQQVKPVTADFKMVVFQSGRCHKLKTTSFCDFVMICREKAGNNYPWTERWRITPQLIPRDTLLQSNHLCDVHTTWTRQAYELLQKTEIRFFFLCVCDLT